MTGNAVMCETNIDPFLRLVGCELILIVTFLRRIIGTRRNGTGVETVEIKIGSATEAVPKRIPHMVLQMDSVEGDPRIGIVVCRPELIGAAVVADLGL
jgi:hypothetical protein